MIRHFLLLVFLLNIVPTWGQILNGKISGIILDSASNTSLELATVSIFDKDSVLINYQLSDKNGNFSIGKIPLNRNFRLEVSYVGYKPYRQYFRFDSLKTSLNLKVGLAINLDDSNAVVVKSIVPIRMNGDTLEINPAAFKMEKTAVAEELLNQVPGIVIWADGSITVNGRPVPKILVDGKPLLNQNDPTVATQNLPKNAIEKIQLYQEVDRNKEQRDNTEQDSIYTMNIKLKENKKTGYFGKAGAGYGTDNRYESDGSIQAYNKTNSLAIGGGVNNINKSVGSIQQMLGNNTFRKMNPNIFNVGSFGRNGINKSFSLGAQYTHDFIYSDNGSRYNSISSNYAHTGNDNFVSTKSLQERTTSNFSQFIESESTSNVNSFGNTAGLSYRKSKNNSKNFNLNAQTSFNNSHAFNNNFTSVKDSTRALQSSNDLNTETNTKSQSGNIGMALSNFSSSNPLTRFSLSASANFTNNVTERNTRSIFDSYTDPTADASYNRLYNTDNQSRSISINFNYFGLRRLLFRRFNLFKTELNANQSFSYSQNSSTNEVNDYDSTVGKFIQNNSLSNYNKVQTILYTPSLTLQKFFNKWTARNSKNISLSLKFAQSIRKEMNNSTFAIRNVDRSFSFFTPSFNIFYNYGARDKFMYNMNAGYSRNFSYPSVDQLYTITDSINLYSVRFGNPNLKNTRSDNFNLNLSINKRKPKAKYELSGSASGNIGYKTNPVADSIINQQSGKRLMYYVNAGNGIDFSLNYAVNIARKFRKSSIQLQYGGSSSNNRSSNFIDGIASNNRSNNLSHNISLQYSLKTMLILKLSEGISNISSSQSASGLSSFKVTNISTQFGATLNISKDISFNTTISTTNNSNIANNIVLWHAFASYRFLQGKQGELKFSAFDLLKKFQNININSNIDGTTTTVTNGLRQYFLLTFSYYPRKFGKKDSDD